MRKALKRIGTIVLFAIIALCLAPTLVPPFLDRIYYRGPVSGHFDGERFYNPGFRGDDHGGPQSFATRWLAGDKARWPERVAVPQSPPSPTTAICRASELDPDNIDKGVGCAVAQRSGRMFATWIGHSTVLIQAHGLNILTDPVWSDRVSPFTWIGPRRARRPGIRFEDLPPIDLVLVSHNHYDHMDVPTLKRLWKRDRPLIVTSLGNDSILRREGIEARTADWGGTVGQGRFCAQSIDPCSPAEIKVTLERVHHWSSRWGADRNRALWSGFTVHLPGGNLFYSGDTGWGDGSWVREAAGRGPIRLAIIPVGAYEPRDFMKSNHIDPGEAVRIHKALRPAMSLGVHWGTFQLTFEGIDDPPRRLRRELEGQGVPAGRFVTTEVGRAVRMP